MGSFPKLGLIKTTKLITQHMDFQPGFALAVTKDYGEIVQVHLKGHRLMTTNPDLAQKVFKGSFRKIHKSKAYQGLTPYQGNGALIAEDDDWLRQRKLAAPFFLKEVLGRSQKIIEEEVQAIGKKWEEHEKAGRSFDLVPDMNELTFKVLTRVVMGKNLDSFMERLYEVIVESIYLLPKWVMSPIDVPLWVPTPMNIKLKRSGRRYKNVIKEIIAKVKEDGDASGLLGLLLKSDMTEQEVEDNVATMLAAGFETTANAASWTWGMIGKYPEVQEKLYQAIKESQSHENPYLTAVVNETLRMNPPILYPSRRLMEPLEFEGTTLPKGTTIDLSIYGLHHNKRVWGNPEVFDPDRFLKPLTKDQENAFVPFASGPRDCVGKNLALLEVNLIISTLLSKFKVTFAKDYELLPEAEILLRPKGGVWVNLEKRKVAQKSPSPEPQLQL